MFENQNRCFALKHCWNFEQHSNYSAVIQLISLWHCLWPEEAAPPKITAFHKGTLLSNEWFILKDNGPVSLLSFSTNLKSNPDSRSLTTIEFILSIYPNRLVPFIHFGKFSTIVFLNISPSTPSIFYPPVVLDKELNPNSGSAAYHSKISPAMTSDCGKGKFPLFRKPAFWEDVDQYLKDHLSYPDKAEGFNGDRMGKGRGAKCRRSRCSGY